MGPESKNLVRAGFQQVSAALKEMRDMQYRHSAMLEAVCAKLGVTVDEVDRHERQLRAHSQAINEHLLRQYSNGS